MGKRNCVCVLFIFKDLWTFSDLFFLICFFAHTWPETKWTKFHWSAWVKILENMPCVELSRNLIEAGSVIGASL